MADNTDVSVESTAIPTWEESTPVESTAVPTWEESTPVENKFFSPTKNNWNILRKSFAGDPLSFIDNPQIRSDVDYHISQLDNPDQERRKWALAAYFAQMRKEDISFCAGNIDTLLSKYFGGETVTVDAAYKDIGVMLNGGGRDRTFWEKRPSAALVEAAGDIAEKTFNAPAFLAQIWAEGTAAQLKGELLARNPAAAELIRDPREAGEMASDGIRDVYRRHYAPIREWGAENMALKEDWVFHSDGIADWFGNAAIATINYLPKLAAQTGLTVATGGVSSLATVYGINSYYGIKDDHPEMTEGQAVFYGVAIGMINGGAERVTLGILKGKVSKEIAKEGIKKGLLAATKHFGWAATKEGFEESVEQFAENLLDIKMGLRGDREEWTASDYTRELFRGVPESAFLGAMTGGPLAYDSFRNLRQLDERRHGLRRAISDKVAELEAKENLKPEEEQELAMLRAVDDAGNPADVEAAARNLYEKEIIRRREEVERDAKLTEDELLERDRDRAAEDLKLLEQLPHNPQDTVDAANAIMKMFPGFRLDILPSADALTPAMRARIKRERVDEARVRSWVDDSYGVHLIASRVRPSEVTQVIGHEIIGHYGLKAVFGTRYDQFIDLVYREHFQEVTALAPRYNRDTESVENQRYLTEEFLADCADAGIKPSWWKGFLQQIKMSLRKLPLLHNLRVTDREIEHALSASARAMRRVKAATTGNGNADGGIKFAAALRREGAPNRAGEPGKIVVGNFPAPANFMEWAGLKGNGLYVDAEMLVGKHPEYFQDQVHALAATAFVLDAPEKAVDIGKNFAFVRWDAENDTGYRIEIAKKISGKRNQIRSAHKITREQYQKAKIEGFPVLQPSQTGSQERVQPDRSYSDLVEYYTRKYPNVKFSIIGEQGAARLRDAESRLANLNTAREMLEAGKDMKTVKLATGWEKGGDGKWRTESNDDKAVLKFMDDSFESGKSRLFSGYLHDFIDDPELFAAYPDLKNYDACFADGIDGWGYFDPENTRIVLRAVRPEDWNDAARDYVRGDQKQTLRHEIQHAIQEIEGFAPGGSAENIPSRLWPKNTPANKLKIAEVNQEIARLTKEAAANAEREHTSYGKGWTDNPEHKAVYDQIEELENKRNRLENYRAVLGYRNLAGEVEARNAASRELQYGYEYRLKTLLAKTEDVAEKDKIYLERAVGAAMATEDSANPDIRFSLSEYSEAEQEAFIKILRPYVGTHLLRSDAEYVEYLKKYGVELSESAAHRFAVEAARLNMEQARKRAAQLRDDWLYENIPLYRECVDFCGTTDFKIKPSPRYRDRLGDFTGTFIAKKKGGTDSDTLAKQIAKKWGRDELEIEDELIEFFKDLNKPGLYKKYYDWKRAETLGSKEAEKAFFDEWMKSEQARIEEEVIRVLERGEAITREWIEDNRAVYKELYRRLFNKEAPHDPGNADFEAINAALTQESSNASTYAEAYKEARKKAYEEFMEKLRALREKVMASVTDVLKLQREALTFAEQNLKPEHRGEFARSIVGLLEYSTSPSANYPEGRRMAEFRNLIHRMTSRSTEERRKNTLDKIAKRLNQLGERVNSGRQVRGLRDIETQNKLNRIIKISRMDGGTLNMALMTNQQLIETRLEDGADASDLEYDIALLHQYGELWNKSADDLELALSSLNELARTGKDNLWNQIQNRAAEDAADRNELWQAVNGMKRLSPLDRKILSDRRQRRWKLTTRIDKSFWKTLSLDGLLESCAFFQNTDNETIIDRFRKLAHVARRDKGVMNLENARACREELARLIHSSSSLKIADAIGQWRKVEENSGVFRFDPDPNEKQFRFERIDVDQARRLLADYDSGNGGITDYEAEAIRQQLRTLDLKVKYDVPEEFRDGATDKLLKLVNQEADLTAESPEIVIPRPTYRGTTRQIPLTQLQGLFLKLMWDQPDIRYKMHYNGYTEESMEQLDRFLLPEVKTFGDWMRSELEQDRKRIDEVYRSIYFASFPHEDFYFPSVYDSNNVKIKSGSVDLAEAGSGANPHAYTPGALKVRVYHLKEPRMADALTVFQNHRLLMNHFVTHAETARKMRSVLLNPDVKGALEAEHGIEFYSEVRLALRDFINGGNIDVVVHDLFSSLYSNAVRSKMAYNFFSGIKQSLGFITYLKEAGISPADLLKGVTYAFSHPMEVYRTLGKTEYFRERWNSGGNADMRLLLDASGRDTGVASEVFEKLDRFGSLPLRFGDAVATLLGGFSVYKYHRDAMTARGVSPSDAHREALLKWEMATERTQQSSSPFLLNFYQRSGYGFRSFTTFLSNQILLWNHNAPAVYKALHYRNAAPLKSAGKSLTALILSSAAMTAFDQMKEHWQDGEYAWWDLFWNTMADGVCGAGPVGSLTADAIEVLKPGGFSRPSSMVIGDAVSGGYALKNLADEKRSISDNDWRDAVSLLTLLGYASSPIASGAAITREIRKWKKTFGGQ